MDARTNGATVSWDSSTPSTLTYERYSDGKKGGATDIDISGGRGTSDLISPLKSGGIEINVVQRSVEFPSDKGWGGSELLSVSSRAGGWFGDSKVVKAVRVQVPCVLYVSVCACVCVCVRACVHVKLMANR